MRTGLVALLLICTVDGLRKAQREDKSAKFIGVNYGNRFIPEKWMWTAGSDDDTFFWEGVVAQGKEPYEHHTRLSLPDLGAQRFKERMPKWLDMMVLESDWSKMKQLGVEVVRIPCGYWNWITYEDGEGPVADGVDAERMKVLTTLPPSAYRKYFDQMFEWAAKYGLKILLDLHGVPGSCNGAEHGGICMQVPQWDKEPNILKTLEAVRVMAEYCADKGSALWGLEIINEPMKFPDSVDVHKVLQDYYHRGILEARKYLAPEVPVVIFEWTYNMHKWPANAFPYNKYGRVMWDAHIYTVWKTSYTLEETQGVYWGDMQALKTFHRNQNQGAFVGEWAIAGTEYWGSYPNPYVRASKLRQLAEWVTWHFLDKSSGAMYWNLDANYTEWSYEKCQSQYGIDWKHMNRPSR